MGSCQDNGLDINALLTVLLLIQVSKLISGFQFYHLKAGETTLSSLNCFKDYIIVLSKMPSK